MYVGLTPMSFNLGSEHYYVGLRLEISLTPMSFNLGSELYVYLIRLTDCLTPMSFNLGSEPLFSNLYLILT